MSRPTLFLLAFAALATRRDLLRAQASARDSAAIIRLVARTVIEPCDAIAPVPMCHRPNRDSVATLDGQWLVLRGAKGTAALNAMFGAVLDVIVGRPIDRIPTADTTFAGWDAVRARAARYPDTWWIDSAVVTQDSAMIVSSRASRLSSPKTCLRVAYKRRAILRRSGDIWRIVFSKPMDYMRDSCDRQNS